MKTTLHEHVFHVQDTQANYFHMNQDNSVFAPLLDSRHAPPADNAAHHPPSADQAHQIVFMTESKVLESTPSMHIDSAPAAVEPIAAPQPSMPQLEMVNGYAGQQQQVRCHKTLGIVVLLEIKLLSGLQKSANERDADG